MHIVGLSFQWQISNVCLKRFVLQGLFDEPYNAHQSRMEYINILFNL
jgi:hypothetical protein